LQKPQTVAGLARLRDPYVVESYLAEVGKVPEGYPSEEEIAKVYAAEKERLQLPRRYQLSQIFIADDGDKNAARKRAQEIADIDIQIKEIGKEKTEELGDNLRIERVIK
jgi:peptidylprolyl isomerase